MVINACFLACTIIMPQETGFVKQIFQGKIKKIQNALMIFSVSADMIDRRIPTGEDKTLLYPDKLFQY